MSTTMKIALGVIAGLIIGALIGWFGGERIGAHRGRKAASDELVSRGILQSPPHGVTSLAGTVLRVDGAKNELTVRVAQMISNPLAEQAPMERLVRVTADTTLLRQKQKSKRDVTIVATPIYFSDLAPNALVSLESTSDILYAQTFAASRIILSEQ